MLTVPAQAQRAKGPARRRSQPQAGSTAARLLFVRCRVACLAISYAAATILTATTAAAQGLPLIRDAEIENLLKDYSRPIFKAAGLGGQNISMRVIRHDSFNAFVVDGRNVFINTGTLSQAKTPNEVIGVIAHETGHITGGHLAQLRTRIARDQTKAILLTVLGIGLMVGGAASGGDTAREVGTAGGGAGIGGRSGRLALPGRDQAIGPGHAGNLRTVRAAGIYLRHLPRPLCAQPPHCHRTTGAVAQPRGCQRLQQRQRYA